MVFEFLFEIAQSNIFHFPTIRSLVIKKINNAIRSSKLLEHNVGNKISMVYTLSSLGFELDLKSVFVVPDSKSDE